MKNCNLKILGMILLGVNLNSCAKLSSTILNLFVDITNTDDHSETLYGCENNDSNPNSSETEIIEDSLDETAKDLNVKKIEVCGVFKPCPPTIQIICNYNNEKTQISEFYKINYKHLGKVTLNGINWLKFKNDRNYKRGTLRSKFELVKNNIEHLRNSHH